MSSKALTTAALVLLSTFLCAHSQPAASGLRQSSPEEQLIQFERDWCTASLKRDAALLGRILADDYTGVSNRGVALNKAETIAGLADKTGSITACVDSDIAAQQK